ncbi:MAG TPA: hypothetical protein VE011_09535 [Candidatus Dormibacteraeota bacterium]|nr:hypothetical protein [Candidatus Dormibacteraeota bacterium]
MLLHELYLRQVKLDRERELASRAVAAPNRPESQSIRRAVGRSIIAIGVRLAAEPQPRLARC